jgi:putative SOS response-associated peptidase YedK
MCGRFTLHVPPELLAEIFGLEIIPVLPARYNIAPGQRVAVIRQNGAGRNELVFARWGLIPSWAKDTGIGNHTINARAETLHEKPAFRHAARYRRGIVPASGFYEWRHDGKKAVPLYVRLKAGSPLFFASLMEHWKSPEGEIIESCSIVTTTANELIKPVHDRMPVIVSPSDCDLWLDREMHDPEQLTPLYQPVSADVMECWEVSYLVNSPRNDTPECMARVG